MGYLALLQSVVNQWDKKIDLQNDDVPYLHTGF